MILMCTCNNMGHIGLGEASLHEACEGGPVTVDNEDYTPVIEIRIYISVVGKEATEAERVRIRFGRPKIRLASIVTVGVIEAPASSHLVQNPFVFVHARPISDEVA